jgi:sugar phosphate permease
MGRLIERFSWNGYWNVLIASALASALLVLPLWTKGTRTGKRE